MQNPQALVDLDNYTPCQLSAAATRVTQTVAAMLDHNHGISIAEWKVLTTVAAHPRLSAVCVAQHAGLDTVAVSRAVTKLMDAGRICREFGREDRRRSILELSEEGRRLYEEIMPMAARLEARLLEHLSDDERRILATALKSLSARAGDLATAFEVRKPVARTSATASRYPERTDKMPLPKAIANRARTAAILPVRR